MPAAYYERSSRERARTVEPSEPYFRERARAERAIAGEAGSPDSRKAHLELAFRYVKAAEALYVSTRAQDDLSSRDQKSEPKTTQTDLEPMLRTAFPLPASGTFLDLLKGID